MGSIDWFVDEFTINLVEEEEVYAIDPLTGLSSLHRKRPFNIVKYLVNPKNKEGSLFCKKMLHFLSSPMFNRACFKRSIMAFPYSLSLDGSATYFHEHLHEIYWRYHPQFSKGYEFTVQDARLLAYLFQKFLKKELFVYDRVLSFFKNVISFFLFYKIECLGEKEDFAFTVKMPSEQFAFKFEVTYFSQKRKRIVVKLGKEVHQFTYYISDLQKPNKQKSELAISPNIIHNLDANLLLLVLEDFFDAKRVDVCTIPDSAAVHANFVKSLQESFKKKFIEMFETPKGRKILIGLLEANGLTEELLNAKKKSLGLAERRKVDKFLSYVNEFFSF